MAKAIDDQELLRLCEKWQKILRLQDWLIYVEVCRARDLPTGVNGHVKIDILKKKAVIAILDEDDHDPQSAWAYDLEKTLVHELIHLHFDTNRELMNEQYVALEQGVEILSDALIGMERDKAPS
jgi:hypothetical protein